jgi:hypothetical protein
LSQQVVPNVAAEHFHDDGALLFDVLPAIRRARGSAADALLQVVSLREALTYEGRRICDDFRHHAGGCYTHALRR